MKQLPAKEINYDRKRLRIQNTTIFAKDIVRRFFYDSRSNISINPITLNFSDENSEKNFNNYFNSQNLFNFKIGIFLTLFLFTISLYLDRFMYPIYANKVAVIRIIEDIFLLYLLYLSYKKEHIILPKLQQYGFSLTTVTGIMMLIIYSFPVENNKFIFECYASIMLLIIASFIVYGNRFITAFISISSVVILMASMIYKTLDVMHMLFFEFLYFSTILLTGVAAYLQEYNQRKLFLEEKYSKQVSKDLQLKIVELKEQTKKTNATYQELQKIYKNTRDSIEYASLIQGAIVSQHSELQPFFKDSFVYWIPKDTVGGDIWLFNELRHEDECLLFFIDCTGHGVPGAFVTMIIKSIEREIISTLKKHPDFDISPAIIMSHFNKTMKILLKQTSKDSKSNAGFDGGIIYYNAREQILKFAGAETPLFYIDANEEFQTVKGNRYSVGYKKCDMDYVYKETSIEVQEGMKFYCTTDGYLDQNGGDKDFPFGKKRFGNIIKQNYRLPMEEQKKVFIDEMDKYESQIVNNDRNDDMTVIAFEIGEKSDFIKKINADIVTYEGIMTQKLIESAMDNIKSKIKNKSMLVIVSTITIEYCQNMMKYSKNDVIGSREIVPEGKIEVQFINNEYYEIIAKNIVSIEDKKTIEPKLREIQSLDKADIKKKYRKLRRSGQNTHEKGGGISLYEIAKVSDTIEYNFKALNEDKYIFMMKSIVNSKKERKTEV